MNSDLNQQLAEELLEMSKVDQEMRVKVIADNASWVPEID